MNDKDFWLKYKTDVCVILSFFIVYLLIYFPMCVRHGVAVEETQFTHKNLEVMLCNGRWGVYLFRVIFNCGEFLPYGAGVLSGLFISVAIYFQTKIFCINKLSNQILYAVLYLSCTQWVYQLRYSNQSHALALGCLCVSAAVYLFHKSEGKYGLLGSVTLLCYSFSTYQTYIFYYGALIGAYLLYLCIKSPKGICNIRDIVKAIWVGGLAMLLYYVIGWILVACINPPESMIHSVREYQASMHGDYGAVIDASIVQKIKIFLHYMVRMPITNILAGISEGYWVIATIFFPAGILALKVICVHKLKAWLCLLFIYGVIIIPYIGNFIFLAALPVRTYIAEPVALASVWGILFSNMHENRLKTMFMNAFGVVIFITAVCRVSTVARDEHWAWQRSKEEILIMYVQAQQLAKKEGLKDCPIYILGEQEIITNHLFDVNKVGFCTQQVYPNIIKSKQWTDCYLYYLRLPRLKRGNDSDIERHQEVYSTMPAWPADGSVKVSKNEIIIRIDS